MGSSASLMRMSSPSSSTRSSQSRRSWIGSCGGSLIDACVEPFSALAMRIPPERIGCYCELNRLFTLLENTLTFKRLSALGQQRSEVAKRVVRAIDHVLAHDVD